jgi:peptidoglycan-associated lipoprotein
MISFYKYVSLRGFALLLGCQAFSCAILGQGVAGYAQVSPLAAEKHDVQVGLTFGASGSNLDFAAPTTSFLYGGIAEFKVGLYEGIGAVASFTGLHTSNSGQGVPINLVAFTFGPRITLSSHSFRHNVSVYGQALGGDVIGFNGLYPAPNGPTTSANSLAVMAGGGLDIGLSRHISLRALSADWLRSMLPNGTTNVQKNLQLGVGIVLHSAAK